MAQKKFQVPLIILNYYQESAAKASGSITDSLMKTSQMMAEHLQRSNETIETLG